MKLFVDDERQAPVGWIRATSCHEAMDIFDAFGGACEAVSIDHDLGDGPSGYDFATWLELRQAEGFYVPSDLACHSANPVGRARIEQCLASIRRMQDAER